MKKTRKIKPITGEEFDKMAEQGQDLTPYMDWDKALFYPKGSSSKPRKAFSVQKVNVDLPDWMVKLLDREAIKLNISRQAVIKTWIRDRLDPQHHFSL